MKFATKVERKGFNKKSNKKPDPILNKTKKKIGKLGSSQRKRAQKRIKKEVNKGFSLSHVVAEKQLKESLSDKVVTLASNMVSVSDNPFNLNDECDDDTMGLVDDSESEVEVESLDAESMDDKSVDDKSMDDKSVDDKSMDDTVDIVTNISSGENTITVTDLDSLNGRIQTNLEILSNFKQYKKRNVRHCHPRSFYVRQWLGDLCTRFSYNKFLIYKFYQIFNMELLRFLVASDEERPLTIRTNTLKTRRRQLAEILTNKDCNVENLQFSKVGMVVHSAKCSIGATSEYLAGHYLLQGSSSMLPVMALAPKPGERILDLCAAPGGKSTHIAQIMKNSGCLYVNDNDRDRLKAVKGNLSRMGVINALVSCHDGRTMYKKVRNCDRVLCDAPCTGTGVISKDRSIKSSKDESDVKLLTIVQKQLLCAAIDACKVGGYVVYSTCSVLVEENEQVIDYVCRKRGVKIVETGLFGMKGFVNFCSKHFNNKMDRARRYYPHENNMDGFFVAKLQKRKQTVIGDEKR